MGIEATDDNTYLGYQRLEKQSNITALMFIESTLRSKVLDRLITKARQLECFSYTNVDEPDEQKEEDEEDQVCTQPDEFFVKTSLEGAAKLSLKFLQMIRLPIKETD